MKHLHLGEQTLEYRDFPAREAGRPPILLLHEGLGCVAMWRKFPEQLAAATGCRVIVWSRAGYGASTPYSEARTPRYMHREAIEALPAFADALGIKRAILVGHSDGGSIALLHAAAFPERVAAVAVMAPHEFVEAETLSGIRAALEAWQHTDLPQKLARYHVEATRVFEDWALTWLSPEFLDWNIEAALATISCPVLAIQGLDDEYATMRQIEVIADAVPGTRLLRLPNCGHSPHKDQEAVVLSALAEFVADVVR